MPEALALGHCGGRLMLRMKNLLGSGGYNCSSVHALDQREGDVYFFISPAQTADACFETHARMWTHHVHIILGLALRLAGVYNIMYMYLSV